MGKPALPSFRLDVQSILLELGADPALLRRRGLPLFADARQLRCVGLGSDGRDKFLAPAAAGAWLAMRDAAAQDGVELLLISAFRSFAFQLALIRGKLAKGRSIEEILTVNAPPGCSEHHSGRAVDIGVQGVPALEEAFEHTDAYNWLSGNAQRFGFHLSYPRGNPYGYLYEPWHWCWDGNPLKRGQGREWRIGNRESGIGNRESGIVEAWRPKAFNDSPFPIPDSR